MAHIVKGEAFCMKLGCGKSWPRDPVLEVECSDCRAPIGAGCRRPSGHSGPFVELHTARDLLADRLGFYGPCPLGLCGVANRPKQTELPLFD
ncbi:hypothetical protein GG804_02130 [Sphingomonas histidinilytica]|uniref:zinc finger domain-containing protein n=1 Tax=Rhizorhabdus histidinilytica TaxID=439228 RepID=UPI001AD9C73A|nr:hypothetical protein [Rhizorhabdus histidinilytica]MBO9375553.1 hypothetical protein [Rhizorhabdus histidinilytica]